MEEMQRIAEKRGGKCFSNTYINSKTKLLWECVEGHKWEAKPSHVKSGHWCPHCAGVQKLTIEEMQHIAERNNGKCISKNYDNTRTKLLWECSKGHQWEAPLGQVKSGSWCPYCAGKAKLTIEEMQRLAKKRAGKCRSKTYIDGQTKLLWECAEGHQWEAIPNSIKRGTWCRECSTGLGERICREFFEQIFEKKFPKSYPRWLINQKGNQMELDGYCQPLGIAFEHHGEQHYSVVRFFLKSGKGLRKR